MSETRFILITLFWHVECLKYPVIALLSYHHIKSLIYVTMSYYLIIASVYISAVIFSYNVIFSISLPQNNACTPYSRWINIFFLIPGRWRME